MSSCGQVRIVTGMLFCYLHLAPTPPTPCSTKNLHACQFFPPKSVLPSPTLLSCVWLVLIASVRHGDWMLAVSTSDCAVSMMGNWEKFSNKVVVDERVKQRTFLNILISLNRAGYMPQRLRAKGARSIVGYRQLCACLSNALTWV